ncbi:transient receptor potential cation channel subfamily V member 5-like [Ruditapes philippinarum]|uniref:transient receptor potential cation channel subfamily V member 5-like n=1 Tax=Ruditapes philippinarum TaxID=129788 RepID=UPI00295AFBD4|nr:transient receptor potential cation channel subfamily V member 5-like [Ruditapes philippinarum]XP_060578312.1 transient receptor potential cation channel subfamily V member 5-like [Ruditapes philippinarum]
MEDIIEETPIETYKHVPDKLDIYGCIEDMAKYPERAKTRLQTVEEILKDLKDHDGLPYLTKDVEENRKGETVLHTAIKIFQFKSQEEKDVTQSLISVYPKLILSDRESTEYAGQTPFHMAVCKGNIWLVNTLLKQLCKKDTKHWKSTLLKRKATGKIFTNTVMMGEVPLTIAALTFNRGMFDLLLNEGADLDGTNSLGDNVCHSLIRYGYLYPEKLNDVLEMCRKINEDPAPYDTSARAIKNRKLRKKIWLMENLQGLNPLQLAVTLGQHQVFSFIMDQEAYCFENSKDGLFDIKIYDITEIDAISSMKSRDIGGVNESMQNRCQPENVPRRQATYQSEPFRKSVLMMLFDLEPSVAFQFILFPPLMRVVNQKWNAYRKYFYPWWIFHTIFMFFHTWYCVERSRQNHNSQGLFSVSSPPVFTKKLPYDPFVTTYGTICIIVSVVYLAQEVLRMTKKRMPWTLNSFLNPYSSGWFRVMFVLFGLCLIIDFILAIVLVYYENYLLIVAMVLGWFLEIFFIRAIKPFSFFTVMIQKVLIIDMSRFFVIIGIEILAFATAMYMAIQGSSVAESTDYRDIWRTIFSMFSLMVGVGDLVAIYDTRHPTLCIIILVGFIVMTTLLMLNALIAMMSRTCMELVENVGNVRTRERHWKLQKLSVILFFESILPGRFVFKAGECQEVSRYNNTMHRRRKMKRYMLEVRSLQNEDGDGCEEGTISTSWGFRTAVFNALKNNKRGSTDRPLSGISDKIRHAFRKMSKKKAKKKDADDDKQDHILEPSEQRPVQIQPPVSHVFGLNPMAADNGFPNGGFAARNPRQAEIDIYHVNLCRQCSVSDVTRDCDHQIR